jgi:hypothetical protein
MGASVKRREETQNAKEKEMKAGDKVSVILLWAYQKGKEEVPFDAIVSHVDDFFIGEIKVVSISSGIEYRLDPTQYELYD